MGGAALTHPMVATLAFFFDPCRAEAAKEAISGADVQGRSVPAASWSYSGLGAVPENSRSEPTVDSSWQIVYFNCSGGIIRVMETTFKTMSARGRQNAPVCRGYLKRTTLYPPDRGFVTEAMYAIRWGWLFAHV